MTSRMQGSFNWSADRWNAVGYGFARALRDMASATTPPAAPPVPRRATARPPSSLKRKLVLTVQQACSCRHGCLKLYCDCYAAGRRCKDSCTCTGCGNLTDHAAGRRKRTKPCHCTKGCDRRYCECFAAGTPCTTSCHCTGCRNPSHAESRCPIRRDQTTGPASGDG